MIAEALSRQWWRRYERRNSRSWQELDEFPRLAPAAQKSLLAQRLLDQIRYFGGRADALPEWREAAAIRDPADVWKIWPSLPIVTKDILRSRFSPEELLNRFNVRGTPNSTGGSTGEPTRFVHDLPMILAGAASLIYAQRRMGWRPGMMMVKVWGSERDIGRALSRRDRITNRLLRIILIDGYRMTDETALAVLRLVQRGEPLALSGFSAMLEFVAQRIAEMGIEVPRGRVVTSWNGGEMLLPHQVELFKRVFGVPIFNLYGGRELSVMAFQEREASPLRVLRPWLFAEIVDDTGKPVAPGQTGRLLWTSTICRATPFLRYDVGDLAVAGHADDDSTGIAQIAQLQGRTSGLLRLPDGKVIQNLYWNHLFKDIPEVRQFQVVLLRTGGLKLLLVGSGFTAEREAGVLQVLREFLKDTPITLSWVDRIPLTSQGKLIQVVQEPPSS